MCRLLLLLPLALGDACVDHEKEVRVSEGSSSLEYSYLESRIEGRRSGMLSIRIIPKRSAIVRDTQYSGPEYGGAFRSSPEHSGLSDRSPRSWWRRPRRTGTRRSRAAPWSPSPPLPGSGNPTRNASVGAETLLDTGSIIQRPWLKRSSGLLLSNGAWGSGPCLCGGLLTPPPVQGGCSRDMDDGVLSLRLHATSL